MVRPESRFERIARRLTLADLRASDAEARDVFDASLGTNVDERFVDVYSADGLARAFRAYGVGEELARRGLGDFELEIGRDDSFRHRLTLKVAAPLADRRIMDLRVHLRTEVFAGCAHSFDVVWIEWLLMQNPRAAFSADRPRLPGQAFPGTGMGRIVHNMLVILCQRLSRDALVTVPERFHLAELYQRSGWRFVEEADAEWFAQVQRACAAQSFARRAWALERGFCRDPDGKAVEHRPMTMILPVSARCEQHFAQKPAHGPLPDRFVLDLEGFERSLRDDPVPDLDDGTKRRSPQGTSATT